MSGYYERPGCGAVLPNLTAALDQGVNAAWNLILRDTVVVVALSLEVARILRILTQHD